MRFSASVTAFLLALPACLAAPSEPQSTQYSHDTPTMVSYVVKDGNGDLYFLCAGSGGNPTAVYRKTGTVEPGCVYKYSTNYLSTTLESTYAKGTYLGRHGTDFLSLGELGDNYWYALYQGPADINIEGAKNITRCDLAINLFVEATDPKVKTSYYPNPLNATEGDNQKATITTEKPPGMLRTPALIEINWGYEDPTAGNNPK